MPYPEPSSSDHEAPWNMDEYEDPETGEVSWVCSCTGCTKKKRDREDD